jgi:aminoglycoside 2'-N-acetyltransferase I
VTVRVLPTTEAAPDVLAASRALMDLAFDEFTDDDWAHALGGHHVVVADGGTLIAHAAVVPRTIEVADRTWAAGYVEAVGTRPDRQGQGLGSRVMAEIAAVVRARFELGVLSTGEYHFYERLGWEHWQGATYVRDGATRHRTPDEDAGIMVLRVGPSAGLDLTASITCETRAGDDW